MEIIVQFVLLAFGFLMLVKGADWFVEGAAGIAEKFGIPQLVVGLTIVAMGTSAPEAAVSITAAMKENADITVGNVVGSNILNVLIILGITSVIVAMGTSAPEAAVSITAAMKENADITVGNVVGSNILNVLIILGITSVIVTIAVAKSTVKIEIPYMILITLLFMGLGFTGGEITFWEGMILWAAFLLYLGYLFWMAMKNKEETPEEGETLPVWKLLILTVGGLLLVVYGSDVTVDAATAIAKAAGVSQRFIGLTIVALGTSLPELVTSVSAARKGKADIAIGNIVGSNILLCMEAM